MRDWFNRFGGFALIAGGWLLLTGLIPSAAGPADALKGTPAVAAPSSATGLAGTAPRLIAAPQREPWDIAGIFGLGRPAPTAVPTAVPATPAPTAVPPTPVPADVQPEAPATPQAAPTAEPAPAPALPPTDRIVIPRIAVDTKVVDVGILPSGEMETASFAGGRLSFSAQAGEAGNAVIAGHNDIEGEVFRRLPELREGDEIFLYRGEVAYRYVIVVRTILREDGATTAQRLENAKWMDQTEGPTCTLISCYPYRVDTHRIVVHAVLVEGPITPQP